MMLSFICWVIVVALFCVAAWRIARRRYTGGLNIRLLKRYRRAAARRYAVYFIPERTYGSRSAAVYKVYDRGWCWESWPAYDDAVRHCMELRREYVYERLEALHSRCPHRRRIF